MHTSASSRGLLIRMAAVSSLPTAKPAAICNKAMTGMVPTASAANVVVLSPGAVLLVLLLLLLLVLSFWLLASVWLTEQKTKAG